MDLKHLITTGAALRENNRLPNALNILTKAVFRAGKSKDYFLMITALGERCLVYKHFYLQAGDLAMLVLAKKDAEAMREIGLVKKIKDKLHTTYFLLGEVSFLWKDYKSAIINFKLALEYFKGSKAEKGDWTCHLGEALYRYGRKKEGKRMILQGIRLIKRWSKTVKSFLVHIWLSGAYLKMAKLLAVDAPLESENYFKKAKEIIRMDKNLILRKKQFRQFKKSFI